MATETVPTAIAETLSADELPVGTAVRLVDLKSGQYNHHVGRVAIALGENGRIGILLHGVVCGHSGKMRQFTDVAESNAIMFKPHNLRRIKLPESTPLSSIGCLPAKAILRMLGEDGWGLPNNVAEQVAGCLRIHCVIPAEIGVTGCSSIRGDFPLGACLNTEENEWWISGAGTTPGGVGSEYLEFSMGSEPRRVSFVAMKIPPLPHGPLSVRDFHVLALRPGLLRPPARICSDTALADSDTNLLDSADHWIRCPSASGILQTLDRRDLQEFALVPPVETTVIRVVCTRNAAADEESGFLSADCIGLFQIAFA